MESNNNLEHQAFDQARANVELRKAREKARDQLINSHLEPLSIEQGEPCNSDNSSDSSTEIHLTRRKKTSNTDTSEKLFQEYIFNQAYVNSLPDLSCNLGSFDNGD